MTVREKMTSNHQEGESSKSPHLSIDARSDTMFKNSRTDENPSRFDKESHTSAKSDIAITGLTGSMTMMPRKRSVSRDSSVNDEQSKSLIDSISATSGRNNWSGLVEGKDLIDDDPSMSSMKGDSISATIAYYNRKQVSRKQKTSSTSQNDNQSRGSCGGQAGTADGSRSVKNNDNLSNDMNYYPAGTSSTNIEDQLMGGQHFQSNMTPGDRVSVSSNTNTGFEDASDIIEECANGSTNNSATCNASRNDQGHKQSTSVKKNNHIKTNRRCPPRVRRSRNIPNQSHSIQRNRRQSSNQTEQVVTSRPFEYDDLPNEAAYQIEPIIIKGNGNLTLFGLSNSFNSEFPSTLVGRVSREEFDRTMNRINALLKEQQSLSARLLLFGGLFCCCSLGFSLVWPSIVLKKRSRIKLEKLLLKENSRLYTKLGLSWKLAEQRCYGNQTFIEYVLRIEFEPKLDLYLPD